MPGNLATSGKMKDGLPIATRGKIGGITGGPDITKLLMTDDLRILHRNRIEDSRHWFWSHLSDYYKGHSGRGSFDVIWSAWELAADAMREDLRTREYSHIPSSVNFLSSRLEPIPLQLYFGSQAYWDARDIEIPSGGVLCPPTPTNNEDPALGLTYFEYFIPIEFRNIDFLQEFLVEPQTELQVSVQGYHRDYEITSYKEDDRYGKILFKSDFYDIMWATQYKTKSLTEMKSRFGDLVGHKPEWDGWFEVDYFRDIYGLLYSLQHGPTYDNLELGLTIINHFPYAPVSGVVEMVEASELIIRDKFGGEYLVYNGTGQAFQRKISGTWTDIVAGDVLTIYDILTLSVEVYSVINNPTMMSMIPLAPSEARNTFMVTFFCTPTEIDWTASYAFVERAKAYATKPDYNMFMDWTPEVELVDTTHGLIPTIQPTSMETTHGANPPIPDYTVETVYGTTPPLDKPSITTVWGVKPPTTESTVYTVHGTKSDAMLFTDIQTTYGINFLTP